MAARSLILAALLISLISISSAAGPTANPDLYTGAKCGVDFSVPAPGILANDAPTGKPTVSATTQLSGPGSIMVNADGSFVYHPPQNIASGTVVYFYYTATDGNTVTNKALVKITVTCTCHGAGPDVNVCMGTAITPAFLIAQGAGCMGCRDVTPKFDLSKIPAAPVAGQCYPYTVICPSCAVVTGRVCFNAPCEISLVAFSVPTVNCPGHVLPTAAQIIELGYVKCGGCDATPVVDPSSIHWTNTPEAANEWVGEYTVTCTPGKGCGATEKTGQFTSGICDVFNCNALDCNDGNVCTTDSCNPNTGCQHTDNTNACDDGNACTETDACNAGKCVGSNPVTCAASDDCHIAGTCNPSSGKCSSPEAPDGTACTDGNACTQTDSCQAGVCKGTDPVTSDGSEACVNGACVCPADLVCGTSCLGSGQECCGGRVVTSGQCCNEQVCRTDRGMVCCGGYCVPEDQCCNGQYVCPAGSGLVCCGGACIHEDQCCNGQFCPP